MKATQQTQALPYLDRVIAHFEKRYAEPNATYLSARTPNESLIYLLEAVANGTRGAKVVSADWSYAHFLRSYALTELGRPAEAMVSLDRAIALSPGNAMYHAERGHLYQQARNWPEALKAYERAAELAKATSPAESQQADLARAWRGIGFVYIEQGRLEEAEALYRKCLDANPNDTMARHELKYIGNLRGSSRASGGKLPIN